MWRLDSFERNLGETVKLMTALMGLQSNQCRKLKYAEGRGKEERHNNNNKIQHPAFIYLLPQSWKRNKTCFCPCWILTLLDVTSRRDQLSKFLNPRRFIYKLWLGRTFGGKFWQMLPYLLLLYVYKYGKPRW